MKRKSTSLIRSPPRELTRSAMVGERAQRGRKAPAGFAEDASAMIPMKVAELTVDPLSNMPILLLRDERDGVSVPIWIGLIEASAIATELEKIALARPMTHDLMREMVRRLGGSLAGVEIRDVRDGTFFAAVIIAAAGKTIELDARPSDAIALALRCGAPIRVARRVVDRAAKGNGKPRERHGLGKPPTEGLHYRELLESLADEDFGKWKM